MDINQEPLILISPVEIKALARHRDGYVCTECGMTAAEHIGRYGTNLDVHRLEPGSVYTVAGCVTICRSCHGPKPKSPRGSGRKPSGKIRGRDYLTPTRIEELKAFAAEVLEQAVGGS